MLLQAAEGYYIVSLPSPLSLLPKLPLSVSCWKWLHIPRIARTQQYFEEFLRAKHGRIIEAEKRPRIFQRERTTGCLGEARTVCRRRGSGVECLMFCRRYFSKCVVFSFLGHDDMGDMILL